MEEWTETVVGSAGEAARLLSEHERLNPWHVTHEMYGGRWFCGGERDRDTCHTSVTIAKPKTAKLESAGE